MMALVFPGMVAMEDFSFIFWPLIHRVPEITVPHDIQHLYKTAKVSQLGVGCEVSPIGESHSALLPCSIGCSSGATE